MVSASFLIAILGAWLWTSFAAPAIARGFGVPMLSGWRLVRRNQHLMNTHYVWACGVFTVGSGLFLFLTLRQYLYCRLVMHGFSQLTGPYLALRLIICFVAGWLFGLFTAPRNTMSNFPLR
jgi:hypothetical protein